MNIDFSNAKRSDSSTVYKCKYSLGMLWLKQKKSYGFLPENSPVDQLMRLKALALAATPGPWTITRNETHSAIHSARKSRNSRRVARVFIPGDADAEFIAACNPDAILKLIGDLQELRAAAAAANFLKELAKED